MKIIMVLNKIWCYAIFLTVWSLQKASSQFAPSKVTTVVARMVSEVTQCGITATPPGLDRGM